MSNTLPGVAKKVFHPCKKCQVERYQVVLAHTSSTSAKLQCEVCGSKNNLSMASSARRVVGGKPLVRSAPKRNSGARWQELRATFKSAPQPYNMKQTFSEGAAVEHPKFGLGFVVAVNGQAIQVVFEDEERSLVHNRS